MMTDTETDTLEPQAGEQTEENESLLNLTPDEPTDENYEAPPHIEQDPADAAIEAKEKATRPDNVEEKFWDDEKGEVKSDALLKSYNSLREKMDSGKNKPPKNGKYSLEEFEGIDPEDELIQEFMEVAKDENLSQAQFDRLTKMWMEKQGLLDEEVKYAKEEELNKLGRNADKIISSMDAWLKRFGTSGVLTQQEMDSIGAASNNATFINAMNKIRRSYGETDIPAAAAGLDAGTTNLDDIQMLMSDERYGKDMAYTASVEKKVYEMHGEKI